MDASDWDEFAAHVSPARALGIRLEGSSVEETALAMAVRPDMLQGGGHVHGGVLATLADTCGVFALFQGLPSGLTLTSIEFKLNFLRPALLGSGDLRARARPVQRGRRVALCEVDVFQAERSVAKGLFTYLVVAGAPPATDGPGEGPGGEG